MAKFHDMSNSDMITHLARAHFKSGSLSRAIRLLQKAFLVDPEKIACFYNLAQGCLAHAHAMLVDTASSVEDVKTSVKLLNITKNFFIHIQVIWHKGI